MATQSGHNVRNAYSIDTKIDDENPLTGTFMSWNDNSPATTCIIGATYNLSNEDPLQCKTVFDLKM